MSLRIQQCLVVLQALADRASVTPELSELAARATVAVLPGEQTSEELGRYVDSVARNGRIDPGAAAAVTQLARAMGVDLASTSAAVAGVRAAIDTAPAKRAALSLPRPPSAYDKKLVSEALRNSDALVFGATLATANIDTAERMAQAGVGTIVVDGPLDDPRDVTHLANAIAASQALLLMKVRDPDDVRLKQNLDAGLSGVLLENPKSSSDVVALMARAYHAPTGTRPVGPSKVNSFLDAPDFVQLTRMERELAPMMINGIAISAPESLEVLRDGAMLEKAGVRLVTIDRATLGRAWDVGAEALAERLAPYEKMMRDAGLTFGATVGGQEEAVLLASRGYRHFTVGDESSAIADAYARYADKAVDTTIEHVSRTRAQRAMTLREIVRAGKMVPTGFLMTPDLGAARALARGAEAVWIDSEHGPFSPVETVRLIEALKGETRLIVRVPQSWNPNIARYLAAGAQGIVAPSVGSAKEAESFVRAVKSREPGALAVPMIETRAGYENREAIARVPGIDLIHMGPFDLAQSMGVARGSSEHNAAIADIEKAARSAGVPLGGLAPTRSVLETRHAQGYRLLTIVSDQEAIAGYFKTKLAPAATEVAVVVSPAGQGYYNRPFVVRPGQADVFKVDGDGTKVALFHGGPNMSIQLAVKAGAALVNGKSVSHRHPQGQLTLILKGTAYLRDGDRKIPLQAGDFVFIPPNVDHAFEDIGGQSELVWMDVFTHNRYTGRPDPQASPEKALQVH